MSESQGDGTDQPDPNRWRALAICLLGGSMVLLDVSIVNVALPSIRLGLSAGESELQWVVSGYALTFGLLLVPAGRIGDMRGRRGMFVVALALFTLASAACGAAPSALFLVIARLVQGLAGGMLTPQISALIQELFRGRERAKAFGLFGSMVGIATAVGPLLGGVLIAIFGDEHGWRAVFFVNVPIGLVAIPLAWKLLPKPAGRQRGHHSLDPVGVVLLGIGAVALLLPFVQEQSWHTNLKWVLVPVAVVVIAVFVGWDARYKKRGHEPLVDLALFQRSSYSFGTSLIALYFAGFTPLFFVFSLFLQTGQRYSALLAGLAVTPFALGSGVMATVGSRFVDRLGRKVVVIGLICVLVGFATTFVAVRAVPDNGTGWATALPLLLAGLGNGLVIAPNQTLTLSEVPVRLAGAAGGVLQTGQRIGSAVGIAAVGSAFFAHLASSRGDYSRSFEIGVFVAGAFVLAALILAAVEAAVGRRQNPHGHHEDPARHGHGGHRLADASTDAYRPPELAQ